MGQANPKTGRNGGSITALKGAAVEDPLVDLLEYALPEVHQRDRDAGELIRLAIAALRAQAGPGSRPSSLAMS